MKFSIKTDLPEKQRSDVLVLGVYDSLKVAYDKPILSTSTISYLASILKHGDMSGKAGSSLILYNVPGTKIPKILLIGLGKEKELDGKKYRAAVRSMIDALKKMDVKTIASYIQIAGNVKEAMGLIIFVRLIPELSQIIISWSLYHRESVRRTAKKTDRDNRRGEYLIILRPIIVMIESFGIAPLAANLR